MRGTETKQSSMLCLMSPESRVPASHPLRQIKALADEALAKLSPMFDAMYSATGRPSIPPERLLKSSLLMALYTVRSERLFCEQLDYNLLFRWFLDMDMLEPSFDSTAFTSGYGISQRVRKRVEEVFGWMKTVGNFRKTRYVGLGANPIAAYMIAAAYNLLRIAKLCPDPRLAHRVLT